MAGARAASLLEVDDTAFYAALEAKIADLAIESIVHLETLGTKIANKAKSYCAVDTGRLRSSLGSVTGSDSDGLYVEVGSVVVGSQATGKQGNPVKYGVYVEFGTSKQPAQPFMRPAIAEVVGYDPYGAGGAGVISGARKKHG